MKRATAALGRYAAVVAVTAILAACGAQASPAPSSAAGSANPGTSPASQEPAATAASSAALSGTLNIAYWDYGPAAETGNQAIADGFMKVNPGVTVTVTPVAGENWGG